jgi:8-amino-7-oxononanoate synthase
LKTYFEKELASLEEQGLLRDLRKLPESGGKISVDGRRVLNFSSNDYLNLARHPQVKDAARKAISRLGCGATASRLMSGHLQLHEELETDLARMVGTEAALVFGSGFLANLGVLTALAGEDDEIFADQLNHASLIDGTRLSRAKSYRYQHRDLNHLESLLKKSKTRGHRLIVSDSLFSMDGDIAPLEGLAKLAHHYQALLVVDEAHAVGVMGKNGGGVCNIEGKRIQSDVILGTLSKALGGYGGFAACSHLTRKFLINRARSFIYSTGLPPACLGSSRKAISIIESRQSLGSRLLAKARRFRGLLVKAGFSLPEFESQILPIHIGSNEEALRLSQLLWEQDILAPAVRLPTVPVGTSRLRLSVNLAHTNDDLKSAAGIMAESARKTGVI